MHTTVGELKCGDMCIWHGVMYEVGDKEWEAGFSTHTYCTCIDTKVVSYQERNRKVLANIDKVWKIDTDFDLGII